ncbi:thioesterase II family protein [uncultured Photobacterium sp.]|uniref:thioesterase II family protein n=1 Tax=uncultured Photobacterium sp. TaxID=173973 RepID=UPI002626D7B0|nr:thioesterase domain-containing protein [uncultured Photobacterium sp.]
MAVLLFPPKNTASVRVFCFPFAGGNASAYLKLISQLPEWLDVFLVEMPGHGTRAQEALVNDIQTLSGQLYQELKGYCDRPYAL